MASTSDRLDITRTSDVELVRMATGGNNVAFSELVSRHGGSLRTHMRRMGAQSADADDMAQEAFMTAYEHLTEYRFDGPLIGWLKKIASRRYLRKVRSSAKYVLTDDVTSFDVVEHRDLVSKVHNLDAALDRLRPAERLCVTLNFSGELSHQEIADELKIPLGTVKSHIRRGLEQLKTILSPSVAQAQKTKPFLETGS